MYSTMPSSIFHWLSIEFRGERNMILDKTKLDLIEKEIRECGEWAKVKQSDLHVKQKSDLSPVTEVDISISNRVLSLLKELFPEGGIISEEETTEIKDDAPYTFVLDPIDGTDVYSQGLPSFCIALGILDDKKEPVGAMIYAPRFGNATEDGLFLRLDPEGRLMLNGKEWKTNGDKSVVKQIALSSSNIWRFDFSKYRGKVRIFGSTILHILAPVVFSGIQASINEPCFIWDYAAAHAVIKSQGMDLYNPDGSLYRYTEDFLHKNRSATCCYGGFKDSVDILRELCPLR